MARFASALGNKEDPGSLRLSWLAGLLEGEGTFLSPPPSMPNCPIVACRMTDRDVVERVAQEFGTAVMAIDKGKYRTEFAATLKGERAVTFMADIRPMMGTRRQQAIDSALNRYRPPARKLNFEIAEEIRPTSVHRGVGGLACHRVQSGKTDDLSDTEGSDLSRTTFSAMEESQPGVAES